MIDFNSKFGRFAMKHVKSEYFVWLTTVDSSGTPQPRPVWFIWENDSFVIYSQAKAHKIRHIQKNPQAAVHFNSEDELGEKRLIILTGRAMIDKTYPPADRNRIYLKKYKGGIIDLNMTPDGFSKEYSVAIRISPANLRGSE